MLNDNKQIFSYIDNTIDLQHKDSNMLLGIHGIFYNEWENIYYRYTVNLH